MSRLAIVNQAMLDVYGRDRGTGTALPVSDLRRGDVYYHTGLGCLMSYTGTAWRQANVAIVADDAARTAISTTYPALLHEGFRVWVTATDVAWDWAGGAWSCGEPTITNVTLTSIYKAATSNVAQVLRYPNKRVQLRGAVTNVDGAYSLIANYEVGLGSVPSALAPPYPVYATAFATTGNGNWTHCWLTVTTAGAINYVAATNLVPGFVLSLSSLSWQLA